MNKPIRVLQVVTHMNRGGLESMIMNYYRNIDRTCVQFDFLTHRPEAEKKDFDDEIYSMGGKIFHISALNPFSLAYLKELDSFFKKHSEYKIVHVHQDCLSGIILKVAMNNGIEVRIAHCHSSSQDKGIKFFIKNCYKKNIKKYATKLFACGNSSGRWMFETDKFDVLPNAIDARLYSFDEEVRKSIRKELNLDDAFVIGHVGRFSVVKNQEYLVSLLEYISSLEENVKLLFVGSGERKDYVETIVKKKRLENRVIFTGLRTDIHRIMQGIDVFVMPSLYEGLPVTMIEAQAAGLPCVISDRVPMDCDITGNVKQISLSESPSIWANAVLSYKGFKRCDMYEVIAKNNFDIKKNAEYLQNYYSTILRSH